MKKKKERKKENKARWVVTWGKQRSKPRDSVQEIKQGLFRHRLASQADLGLYRRRRRMLVIDGKLTSTKKRKKEEKLASCQPVSFGLEIKANPLIGLRALFLLFSKDGISLSPDPVDQAREQSAGATNLMFYLFRLLVLFLVLLNHLFTLLPERTLGN